MTQTKDKTGRRWKVITDKSGRKVKIDLDAKMTIYTENWGTPAEVHTLDRLPETKGDLDDLKATFPLTMVYRKTNGYCARLEDVTMKSIHWYGKRPEKC